MALSKVDFNSINVTPAASKAIKFNSSNNGFETGDVGGSLVLISTQTASSSATIDFTSGIDSTYKEYIFKFIDIHPATDEAHLTFQADTGTNTNYNQTITSTFFRAYHDEADNNTQLAYIAAQDLAQSTSFKQLNHKQGNGNDESAAGTLQIFNPASTTFVKHFIGRNQYYYYDDYSMDVFTAGYFNTTTALTRVRFKMSSGNIDSGTIKMYGVT